MKILFISYNGALEPLIKSQGIPYLKGLSEKGVECILLSFEKLPKDRDAFKVKTDNLREDLEGSGIKWHWLRYHKSPSLPATLFDIFMGIVIGFWLVLSGGVDIVHARATVPAVMAYVVARLTRRKFIFDERGLMAEEYVDGGIWKRGGIYKLTRYIEKRLLNGADAIVVLTENIKDFLLNSDYLPKDYNGRRPDIATIPCCVDTKKFNSHTSADEKLRRRYRIEGRFVFLYSGSLGTWYLLDEMIDFFLVAKSVIDNAHFMALTPMDKEMVRDSWARRGLPLNDVTIEGVEFERVPEHIKLADAGLFFIKPVLSKRSSCPIKFAEYLACGLPVVINSGIGDMDAIVERHRIGAVIGQFNQNSYLNGINRLLELMKEKKSLSDRCSNVARGLFSLELGVSRYHAIYNKVF